MRAKFAVVIVGLAIAGAWLAPLAAGQGQSNPPGKTILFEVLHQDTEVICVPPESAYTHRDNHGDVILGVCRPQGG
jgi:hypothetical protein